MIISPSLLGIAENLVGTHDSAEFKSGIQVFRIDVRMDSLDRATERSPQLIGIVVRKRAEQIVKRLHGNALSLSVSFIHFPLRNPQRNKPSSYR